MYFNKILSITTILLFIIASGYAQVNVAVSDFLNKTDALYLDAWERSVPGILRSQLSANEHIVVLDRDKLDKVIEEQALSLSGLLDSSSAQSIGKLLDADFILSGSIDKQNDDFVISADLIRVKTGEVQTEIVQSKNKDYKNAMVDMLANNLLFRLTGDGIYQEEVVFQSNSIWYWTGSTLLLGGATLFTNSYYNENLDNYKNTTKLKDFDKYYDSASTSKNVLIGLASITGVALIGTLIDAMSGDSENKIRSGKKSEVSALQKHLYVTGKNEIKIGLQIHF